MATIKRIPAVEKKTMILVPDSPKGPYGILYDTAKQTVKTKAIVTTNWRRPIREHNSINKVIITMGSKGKSLPETYAILKKAHPEMKFILINGFDIKVRKKDKMISFTGQGLPDIIREYL